jgi:hypothetical protein
MLAAQPLRPNPSLKRCANGRPPGPGWRYAVHFRQPGPGVVPLLFAEEKRWPVRYNLFERKSNRGDTMADST